MKTGLLVLWLFSAAGFAIGPIHLGPGWYATRNVFSQDDLGWTHCNIQGMQMDLVSKSITTYGCWVAGDGPAEEFWAKVRR